MWLVYCVHSTTKMILFSENDYAPYRHTNKYWTYQQKISLGLKVQLLQKNATKYFLCLHSVHRFAHKFRIENQPESRWSAPWLQQCQPSHRLPFLFEMELLKQHHLYLMEYLGKGLTLPLLGKGLTLPLLKWGVTQPNCCKVLCYI